MTGFALLDAAGSSLTLVEGGALSPHPRLSFSERLVFIADGLAEVIRRHAPDEAAVEDLFHAVNASSALRLAHVRGAILLELARHAVPLYAYAPKAVKKAVTGVGGADKAQVRAMVERLLRVRLGAEPNDVSDAVAIAICHAHSRPRPTR